GPGRVPRGCGRQTRGSPRTHSGRFARCGGSPPVRPEGTASTPRRARTNAWHVSVCPPRAGEQYRGGRARRQRWGRQGSSPPDRQGGSARAGSRAAVSPRGGGPRRGTTGWTPGSGHAAGPTGSSDRRSAGAEGRGRGGRGGPVPGVVVGGHRG